MQPVKTAAAQNAAESTQQYFTFIVNDQEYGVDILRVQEIRGWTGVRKMPNLPSYIKGVIDLRGVVVPLVDLRERFGMEPVPYTHLTVVVILKIRSSKGEQVMGLVVDSVSDVYDLNPADLKPTPDMGDNIEATFITQLATIDNKMLMLLDIDELLGRNLPARIDRRESAAIAENSAPAQSNPLNVELLEQSFNALAPRSEELVARFYEELFKRHPQVKPMFANTTVEEQQKKLLAALVLVINHLRKPEQLSAALKGLGAKHQAYGAVDEHYDAVAAVLLDVMAELAGELWMPAVASAWKNALTTIKGVMLSGYEAR
jgi:purine-binding chemotaxis protein CheW